MEEVEAPPFEPVNGKVLVRQLPPVFSKIIDTSASDDRANDNEGIVVKVSPHRFARRLVRNKKGNVIGFEYTGAKFEHDVKVGDRVVFRGKYLDDDVIRFNGIKYRNMDPWEFEGVMTMEQPQLASQERVLDLIK